MGKSETLAVPGPAHADHDHQHVIHRRCEPVESVFVQCRSLENNDAALFERIGEVRDRIGTEIPCAPNRLGGALNIVIGMRKREMGPLGSRSMSSKKRSTCSSTSPSILVCNFLGSFLCLRYSGS